MNLPVLPTRSASAEAMDLLDPSARFTCSGCGHCCDQPWATVISEADAARYDATDWAADHPQLKGRRLYRRRKVGEKTVLELTKLRGNRCIFLLDDNRCLVHAKLGLLAKPQMCQTFPYLSVTRGDERRVSVNYGCTAVQKHHGRPLPEQADEVLHCAGPARAGKAENLVAIDLHCNLPAPRANELIDQLEGLFAPSHRGSLIDRFAQCLTVLRDASGAGGEPQEADSAAPSKPAIPLGSRMLLAANLYPDICDPARKGMLGGVRLIPKLMNVTQLRGAYASRLLGRNLEIGRIFDGPATWTLDNDSEELLTRYFRSRIWQRHALRGHDCITAAVHQHIIDLATIVFFAQAHAHAATAPADAGAGEFTLATIWPALQLVEFHIANQERLTEKVLQGWFAAVLADPEVARSSLRLVRLRGAGN